MELAIVSADIFCRANISIPNHFNPAISGDHLITYFEGFKSTA